MTGDRDAVIDPRSNRTEVVYDDFGRTSKVINALANTTTFAYDRGGRVVTVTDPRGTPTATGYDFLGRVTLVTEAVGFTEERDTAYTYDAAGDLITVTDPRGTVTKYAYDDAGRVASVTAGYGLAEALATAYTYDDLDRVVQVTAPGGRVSASAFDALGRLTTATDGVGTSLVRSTTYGYDAADNTVSVTDPLGHVTSFTYDKANRLTATTEAVGTADERTTGQAYDAAGRVVTVTDPRQYATTFGYDDAGRLVTVTDALSQTTTYGYDANGNRTSVTDPLSHTTTFAFDALDRLVTVTDPLTHATTYAYDANGNTISVTDPRTNATTFVYDRLDQLASTTNALSETTAYTYDAGGNRLTVTNARSAVTTFAYDGLGRLTTVTDPVNESVGLVYDSTTGDLWKQVDQLGKETVFGYDDLGRRVTVTAPTGGTTTTAYDAGDRVVSVTDSLNHATAYGYDALNRVVTITDPRSEVTTFAYDPADNRTMVHDAVGNKTYFAYDAVGQLTTETDPLGKATGYAYDADGRLVSITDRLGLVRAFTYDAADRTTAETWYDAMSVQVQQQTFAYDAAGNLTAATDPDGNYAITYDALNRAVTVASPAGLGLTFAYDAAGNRTSVTDSQGAVQASTYDLADRLTSRTLDTPAADLRVDFTYTARGETDIVTRYADLAGTTTIGTADTDYDAGGRVTAITHADAVGNPLAVFAYTYDLADRLTASTDNGVTRTFAYDAADQLTDDGGTALAYDGTGNRTNTGYQTGPGNRLTNDGVWGYLYDDAGRVIEKTLNTLNGPKWVYEYDHRGQQVGASYYAVATGPLTSRVEYQYDAFGNRVGRTEYDGSLAVVDDVRYAVDGWDPAKPGAIGTENFDAVADLSADGLGGWAVDVRRVFGAGFDEVLARDDGTAVNWYGADRQGSVRVVFDNAGTVLADLDYDGFGGLLSGVRVDRYGYAGREWDDTLGLQYNRGRMYDPATGRWTSEDPIGFAGGDTNLHRYVANNPANKTDPSGFWSSDNVRAILLANDPLVAAWFQDRGGILRDSNALLYSGKLDKGRPDISFPRDESDQEIAEYIVGRANGSAWARDLAWDFSQWLRENRLPSDATDRKQLQDAIDVHNRWKVNTIRQKRVSRTSWLRSHHGSIHTAKRSSYSGCGHKTQ